MERIVQNLPDDIVGDILSRLPVKSLVQMRCVSKSWRSLIIHRSFIRIHLKRSNTFNFFFTRIPNRNGYTSPSLYFLNETPSKRIMNIDSCNRIFWELVGSGYGLVCLQCIQLIPLEKRLILCNPSTMEDRTLPNSPSALKDDSRSTLGFGRAMINGNIDNYKVVKIDIYKYKWPYSVEVYSLKKDSWTRIGDAIPSGLFIVMLAHKAMVNGSVHWLASKGSYTQSILLFDMADEVFREIMFSDYMHSDCRYGTIGLLEGCLSVFGNIHPKEGLEVWVMKEYGVVESWTKQYVIRFYSDFDNQISYYPFGFTQTGNLVMQKIRLLSKENINSLILYDPRSNKDYFEDYEVGPVSISVRVFSHVESLVSVMSADNAIIS